MISVAAASGIILGCTMAGVFGGLILGRWSMLDRIGMLSAQVIIARRQAGKLSNRIGAQRRTMRKLRAQLKAVATAPTTGVAAPMRPNLPH